MANLYRSILITTCANPALMEKQRTSEADVAFLELEDGVPADQKAEARARAVTALREWDYGGKERWVRINAIKSVEGMRDLMSLPEGRPEALIPGKLRGADEIIVADYILTRREEELGLPIGGIKLCPMIESGPALMDVREIIAASPRMMGVLLGSEDLSADVGIVRTHDGFELDWARGHLVMSAKAMGIKCFDVASVLLRDPQKLYDETRKSYHLGYDGKACISPSQIDAIHRGFAPQDTEIEWARRVIEANRDAEAKGISVFSLDGRMVDAPFIMHAESVLRRAGLDA